MNAKSAYILTLACADRVGIVAAVSGHLAAIDGFILDSQQYADLDVNRFFMRVEFAGAGAAFPPDCCALKAGLEPIAARFGMTWDVVAADARPKLIIAVSRASHCLNDLLHRRHTGTLPVEIAGVVSNHDDLRSLTQWYGVPYHHLPIEPGGKARHEAAIEHIVASTGAEYLVLARYMQVLTPELTDRLAGRCINIHHSFLPSFKGARPYAKAHERGVKLIGATAHFVTSDLDEGPIIEQAVERVDHRATEADLVRIGRDVEAQVLAKAIRWTAERRVFLNGLRTVIFR